MFTLFENPTIEDIIKNKEGQLFDRKGSRINYDSLADSIIGFTNADGGVIIIGVETDKAVSGVEDWEAIVPRIRKITTTLISPPIRVEIKNLSCKNYKEESSNILLIEIPQSAEVHSNSKDEVFLRIGEENKKLNHDQRLLLLDNKGNKSFELQDATGSSLADIDEDCMQEYKEALKLSSIQTEELLIGRDLARRTNNNLILNTAGILLFGLKPERWIERARIRILRYEGIDEKTGEKFNVIKDVPIYGALSKQIKKSNEVLEGLLREFTTLESSGKFITEPEYPTLAWQEAIINALIHRSYAMRGADIQIKMFDNRLEILSPGRFPGLVNEQNIKDTHYSRNPRIARVIAELGFVRELGEGVNRIFQAINDLNLPEPIFRERALSEVVVILKNNIESRKIRKETQEVVADLDHELIESLSYDEKRIVSFIKEYGKITTKECTNLIKKSRITSIRYLRSLVSRQILHSNDLNKPTRHYTLGIKFATSKKAVTNDKNLDGQESLFKE